MDLLEFVVSLILSEGDGIHSGLDIFGLLLLQAALNTGARALARYKAMPASAACWALLRSHRLQLTVQKLKWLH